MFFPHCTGRGALLSSLITLAIATWISLEGIVYTEQHSPNLSPQHALIQIGRTEGLHLPYFDSSRWCQSDDERKSRWVHEAASEYTFLDPRFYSYCIVMRDVFLRDDSAASVNKNFYVSERDLRNHNNSLYVVLYNCKSALPTHWSTFFVRHALKCNTCIMSALPFVFTVYITYHACTCCCPRGWLICPCFKELVRCLNCASAAFASGSVFTLILPNIDARCEEAALQQFVHYNVLTPLSSPNPQKLGPNHCRSNAL
jgi:hypothetical protein